LNIDKVVAGIVAPNKSLIRDDGNALQFGSILSAYHILGLPPSRDSSPLGGFTTLMLSSSASSISVPDFLQVHGFHHLPSHILRLFLTRNSSPTPPNNSVERIGGLAGILAVVSMLTLWVVAPIRSPLC
jgi:hypothetical protein